jgi:hypothetical protein
MDMIQETNSQRAQIIIITITIISNGFQASLAIYPISVAPHPSTHPPPRSPRPLPAPAPTAPPAPPPPPAAAIHNFQKSPAEISDILVVMPTHNRH